MKVLTARFVAGILVPMAAGVGLITVAAFAVVLPHVEGLLTRQKHAEIRNHIAHAYNLIEDYHQRSLTGRLSRAEAQAMALSHVRRLYAKDGAYVWVHRLSDGELLEHPLLRQPVDWQWRNRADEVIRRSGEVLEDRDWARLSYDWPTEASGRLEPKVTYVRAFRPWGWVLGSGTSLARIRAAVGGLTMKIAWILGAVVLLMSAMLLAVIWQGVRVERKRRQAEESLMDSEEKYRLLADCASDGIALIMDDRIEYANPALLEMLGYSTEDMASAPAPSVLCDTGGTPLQVWCAPDGNGQADTSYELSIRRCDGSACEAIVSPSYVRFHDREATILAITDVTERQHAQQERDNLRLQYLQSQKMEAVGRLAGGIAHDFRNQLTVINGYTSLLLRKVSDRSAARRPLEQILKSTALSGKLANQLLAFSRKQPLQPVPVAVNESVRDMGESLGSIIGEDIQLKLDLDEACGKVLVDDGQIEQALMNLAVNARDAMPKGGTLSIRTARLFVDPKGEGVGRGHPEASAAIRLTISDTGTGMDEETRSQIFEPFYTTKEEGKGTGLGLAMVYSFVSQAGGAIDVESTVGQGTSFHLLLPECSKSQAACGEQEASGPSHRDVRGTLLVVEDDDQVRSMLVNILRGYGHTVLEACNALQAMPLGEHYEGRIDLLVTDIVMPGMDGISMAKRLGPSRPRMGLLFISGYTSRAEELRELLRRGAGFLLKPFTPDALLQAVEKQLLAVKDGTWLSDANQDAGRGHEASRQQGHKEI